MSAQWYYAEDGIQKGPVPPEDIRSALVQERIDARSLVWREGMAQWQPLESVEEFRHLLSRPSRPPLPPLPPPVPSVQPPAIPEARAYAPAALPPAPLQAPTQYPPPAAQANAGASTSTEPTLAAGFGILLINKGASFFKWLLGLPADLLTGVLTNLGADYVKEKLWPEACKAIIQVLMVTTITSTTVAAGVTYFAVRCDREHCDTPDKVIAGDVAAERAMGQILIDANPWGRVEWVRGGDGKSFEIDGERNTPFLMSLPVGRYSAQVEYPPGGASERCDLQVSEGAVARCLVDLKSINAKEYFRTIGW